MVIMTADNNKFEAQEATAPEDDAGDQLKRKIMIMMMIAGVVC